MADKKKIGVLTQLGGTPSPFDQLVASAFGVAAADLVAEGKFDRMVAWQRLLL